VTLDRLRPVAEQALDPFVVAAKRLGLSPDGVSVIAFGCAVAAGVVFALAPPTLYLLAAALVFANGWLDIVDGALARATGAASEGGDLLDHVLDRYADVALLVGIAAGLNRYGLGLLAVTGVLLTSYMGTQIQAVGLGREYGGLLGRADRLALVSAMGAATALYPSTVGPFSFLGWALVVLGVAGHLTAVQRFVSAWRHL
jgi:archaetidylinositol phosphate synthase